VTKSPVQKCMYYDQIIGQDFINRLYSNEIKTKFIFNASIKIILIFHFKKSIKVFTDSTHIFRNRKIIATI